jgi:hypothetical protein
MIQRKHGRVDDTEAVIPLKYMKKSVSLGLYHSLSLPTGEGVGSTRPPFSPGSRELRGLKQISPWPKNETVDNGGR